MKAMDSSRSGSSRRRSKNTKQQDFHAVAFQHVVRADDRGLKAERCLTKQGGRLTCRETDKAQQQVGSSSLALPASLFVTVMMLTVASSATMSDNAGRAKEGKGSAQV